MVILNLYSNRLKRRKSVGFSAAKSGNLETLKLLVENGGLSGILMGYNCKAEAAKQKTSRRHSSRFVLCEWICKINIFREIDVG